MYRLIPAKVGWSEAANEDKIFCHAFDKSFVKTLLQLQSFQVCNGQPLKYGPTDHYMQQIKHIKEATDNLNIVYG